MLVVSFETLLIHYYNYDVFSDKISCTYHGLNLLFGCHANSTDSQGTEIFRKSTNGMSSKVVTGEGTNGALEKSVLSFYIHSHTIILKKYIYIKYSYIHKMRALYNTGSHGST